MFQKKSLGQNFLKSNSVANTIIQSAELKPDDVVLEIGPGKGILTAKLLEKSEKVIAVEKDSRLIPYLKDKFKEYDEKKLEIINADILDLNPDCFLKNTKYKIVANIPYYITGQIIKKFLTATEQPEKIILMLQKEVAKRICQKPESLLSISVKVYGEPKYTKTVKAENFSPKPKVDSAILQINNISKKFFASEQEEFDFFKIIKQGFSHKRKLLTNNLKIKAEKLEKLGLNPKSRAEDLSIQDWKKLSQNL